ncbi:hypothetical protein AAE478_002965 [Parahypoxylon ruwenzoriense]
MVLGRWTFSSSGKRSTISSNDNDTNSTTTPTDNETQDPVKKQSRLLQTFAVSFKSQKSKKSGERNEPAHLNKPFTQQNLEHQKILNAFEWNFGKSESSHGGRSSFGDISPSASRNTSVDHGRLPPASDSGNTHPQFSRSLANEPVRENPRAGSDKDQVGKR